MPKLLVFAPCEKVIISQDENNPTLIAVLSDIGGEYETPEPLPEKAFGPMRWSIFSMWWSEAGDENKEYEQTIHFMSPTGQKALDATQDFKLIKRTHRMIWQVGMVPLGHNGEWTLQLFVREKGQPLPDTPLAAYPLNIQMTHRVPAETTNT